MKTYRPRERFLAEASDVRRFWSKVVVDCACDCWIWTGVRNGKKSNPYGAFRMGARKFQAHRVAYETWRGQIPDGMELDHTCEIGLCVNPAHLEVVTGLENIQRYWASHPRLMCPSGHARSGANAVRACSLGRVFVACRICRSESSRKYKQRKKQLAMSCS